MYIVTVIFTIKTEYIEQFRSCVLTQAKNTLERETHCHQFNVCRKKGQSNVFFLYEVYSSDHHFDAHLQSDHFLQFDQAVKNWVVDKVVNIWMLDNDDN